VKKYHEKWLECHSHRTEEWLKDRLKDGFDIHHVDGNHHNNDPSNLVLIECSDHMMMHGCGIAKRVLRYKTYEKRRPDLEYLSRGQASYNRRLRKWDKWSEIGKSNMLAAKVWAKSSGMPWPIKKETYYKLAIEST